MRAALPHTESPVTGRCSRCRACSSSLRIVLAAAAVAVVYDWPGEGADSAGCIIARFSD
jgi:hypothetical protein